MPGERIFVFGGGGHAKVVIDIIERQELYDIASLIDDDACVKGEKVYGYTVLLGRADLIEKRQSLRVTRGVVAIGNNSVRLKVSQWLRDNGFELVTAIHPSAQLGRGVSIGNGTVVMAGAVINSDTRIGENVIINTGATVDHECVIGDGVQIAPGCHLCGNVTVGARSLVGAGTTVIEGITIGRDVLIGAGSTVIRDISDGARVAGTPARALPRK